MGLVRDIADEPFPPQIVASQRSLRARKRVLRGSDLPIEDNIMLFLT